MGQSNLYCFERNDYFRELLTCCIDKKDAKYITPTTKKSEAQRQVTKDKQELEQENIKNI